MLAVAGPLPDGPGAWGFELKWDGMRAVLTVEAGQVRVTARSGRDVTAAFPELQAIGAALGPRSAVLDGEIVAFDAAGRPSFEALQPRIQTTDGAHAGVLAREVPVVLMLFDVLRLDGRSTTALPYRERRRLLEALDLEGPAWATPPSYPGPGRDVLAVAGARGLEGVVAKRLEGPYREGRRHPDWTKVKCVLTQEAVVGGWTAGRGGRQGTVGALLLGIPSRRGLDYVGKVGTGFTDEMLAALQRGLAVLERPASPFAGTVPRAERAGVTWTEPVLVGEVRFSGWTRQGRMRHPSWRGLRPDKRAGEVVRES